jgi:SAM-dependent methyltransferase
MSERPRRLNAGLVFLVAAAGGGCSAAWVIHASVPLVLAQAQAFNWWLAPVAVALTLTNVGMRFLRWQFFLRRAGVRLETRRSAGIFVAGLAMLLTPAYAGEGVKTWLINREQQHSLGRAGGVVLAERFFDAVALALAGGTCLLLTGEPTPGLTLLAAGLAGLALLAAAVRRPRQLMALLARLRGAEIVPGPNIGWTALLIGMALSLVAWLAGSLTLLAVCAGVGRGISPFQAVGTYALSTLLGGLTLLPAGVGVVGTVILLRLEGYGATLQQATLAAVLVRLFTVWLTAGIGIAGSWQMWRRFRPAAASGHFDRLAPHYTEQFSPAARTRVVGRKIEVVLLALAGSGIGREARVLDAGTGQGWYAAELANFGFTVTGVDAAVGQLEAARAWSWQRGAAATARRGGNEPTWAAGSVLRLPFPDGTFDAALATNVLHHIGPQLTQAAALAELARTVRPGGLVIVNEISTANPLFRLYMAYLFPLWKRVDVGTEYWLDARALPSSPSLALERLTYYTFLPDFTPAVLYGVLSGFEARLERSRWAGLGAHFTAAYRRKVPTAAPSLMLQAKAARPAHPVAASSAPA